MAFATGALLDPKKSGAGELAGDNHVVLSADTYENNLKSGLFAKIDAGSLDNLDASVTPVIAGVVLRDIVGAVEDAGAIPSTRGYAEYVRAGLVTVSAVAGESPSFGDAVYAHNAAGADQGKASVADDADTEPTTAEFIKDLGDNIWLIRLV